MILATLDDWFPFLLYALMAFAIPFSMVVMSFVFSTRPKARPKARTTPFESGVSTGPPRRQRFSVRFYLIALLFILFDIEIVLLYPVAVVLGDVGWYAVGAFSFFLGVITLAFLYEWRKGSLE